MARIYTKKVARGYKTPEQKRRFSIHIRAKYKERRAYFTALLGGKCYVCGSTETLYFEPIDRSLQTRNFAMLLTASMQTLSAALPNQRLICQNHWHKKHRERMGDSQHGGYGFAINYRCKCELCRETINAYQRKNRARKKLEKQKTLALIASGKLKFLSH